MQAKLFAISVPQTRYPNIPVSVAAVLLLIWAAILLWRDYTGTMKEQGSRAAAFLLAEEALNKVEDPGSGWYPAPVDPIFSWEQSTQDWVYEADSPASPSFGKTPETAAAPVQDSSEPALQIVATGDRARGNALSVPVSFPDPATVYRETTPKVDGDQARLQGIRFMAYDVFVPRDCPGYVGCLLFLKDKDGLWFQARTRASLVPGNWTTVTADIRGDSPDVTPLGHLGQWDDNQATKTRMLGITFYGDKPYKGQVWLDNFRGWMRASRFQQMVAGLGGPNSQPVPPERAKQLKDLVDRAKECKDDPLEVVNLRTIPAADDGPDASAPVVRRFETLTVRFELNRQVDNPFDPDKADVTCLVKTPGGKTIEHLGFWYQDYDRGERFVDDALEPIGRPEWRVRITPREEGQYTYQVCIKLNRRDETRKDEAQRKLDELTLPPRPFVSVASDSRGFIRVAQKDRRFFEFETGAFFYPIGHNISTPVDIRCWKEIFHKDPPAGRGLAMYSELFPKLLQNRENTIEVWMASWWVGIEWTARWRDYYGAGRYSLQHAWKLDYLMDLAHKHGLYIHLVIDNHGKFSQWCDWEWDNNPYNSRSRFDNGIVATAEDFFLDPTARKWHKNKLRYIAARWGADPTVLGWELVSEYDLVGGLHNMDKGKRLPYPKGFHCSPTLQNWAREMIAHLRQCDPYGHPITNHYATDYTWIDPQLVREALPDGSPLVDYVATDAYRADRPYTLAALRMQRWVASNLPGNALKPFWITEYGGDFNVGVPHSGLDADVHAGMWATWMTDGVGTPLFWWYDFVDHYNLYTYYRAFANYIDGEDRRGIAGIIEPLIITGGTGAGELQSAAYRWNSGLYAWVYNNAAMNLMPPPDARPRHNNVEAQVPALDAGKYKIEYWDCFEGKIIHTEVKDIAAGQALLLKFPTFAANVALKVKKQ